MMLFNAKRYPETSSSSLFKKNNRDEAVLKASDTFSSAEGSDSDYYELQADVAAKLADNTLKSLSKRLGNSEFMLGRPQIDHLPHLKRDEIEVGNLLAHGGFAAIYEIKSTSKPSELTVNRKHRYVMKNSTRTEATTFPQLITRAKHLAVEGHFLSSLDHENIIKLRGWSTGGLSSFKDTPRLDAFFLIFDHLPVILTDRIQHWASRRRGEICASKRTPIWRRRPRHTVDQLICEQLKVALDIASAIEYLHENRIIYRDLKPGNVGFSSNGTLQIFDFGLAVELPLQDDLDQTYKFPGRAGTRRYMSPEVLLEQPYNVKADVYSFSILLWEMISLQKSKLPGADFQVNLPSVNTSWPIELQNLLKRGWCTDISTRPHMKEMRRSLLSLHSSLLLSTDRSKD